MRTVHIGYRFGPFELDPGHQRLTRGATRLSLNNRDMSVLIYLVADAGQLMTKDELTVAAWKGAAISDNSIVQVIKRLRDALGEHPDGGPYIDTLVGKGYRFVAPVARVELLASIAVPDAGFRPIPDNLAAPDTAAAPVSNVDSLRNVDHLNHVSDVDVDVDAPLELYNALLTGRSALETLGGAGIGRGLDAFAEAFRLDPTSVGAHIGMASAFLLGFESTRATSAPDRAVLVEAEQHVRGSLRLDPFSAIAWSTLALVLHAKGERRKAIAAARRAVALEPQAWRHSLCLAFVSWGETSVEAASRVLACYPRLALAHWLAARVFIAREAFDIAVQHLREGCEAQDAQHANSPFAAVGLHLLHGLVLAAHGAIDAAEVEWRRELAFEGSGHLYGPECWANTWYAIGAVRLRRGRLDEACSAFQEARTRVPEHALATIGLKAASGNLPADDDALSPERSAPMPPQLPFDRAMLDAAVLALQNRHVEAARVCRDALVQAEPGPAGWQLPVEPLFDVIGRRYVWASTLTVLRERGV